MLKEKSSVYLLINQICPSMPESQKKALSGKEITEAHTRFADVFIRFLKSIDYEGVIEFDTILVNRTDDGEFRIKTPDIYLPRHNITIEVDGITHDWSHVKTSTDQGREEFNVNVGLHPPYRIDNGDVFIPHRLTRNCKELLALIKSQDEKILTHPEEFLVPKKRIERNRSCFYEKYPELLKHFPSLLSSPNGENWVKTHFGRAIRLKRKKLKRGRPALSDHKVIISKVQQWKLLEPTISLTALANRLGYSTKQLRRILKTKK